MWGVSHEWVQVVDRWLSGGTGWQEGGGDEVRAEVLPVCGDGTCCYCVFPFSLSCAHTIDGVRGGTYLNRETIDFHKI